MDLGLVGLHIKGRLADQCLLALGINTGRGRFPPPPRSARSQDVKASYYMEKKKDDQYTGSPKMTGSTLKESSDFKTAAGELNSTIVQSVPVISGDVCPAHNLKLLGNRLNLKQQQQPGW